MLFNSFEFLLFLPITFILYWYVFKRVKTQNIFVIAASYLFYGFWDWRFLILIFITTLCSYISGLYIGRKTSGGGRWLLIANIVLNIAILGVFKYFNFFAENFQALASLFGVQIGELTINIWLPVGVSFYTFQALGYVIDVYRKQVTATRDSVAYFAYISFFPQLVAGPIERASNLLPQFTQPRKADYAAMCDGLRQMLWGMFKKVVIADNCANAVNYIFDNYTTLSGSTLAIGAVLFTFQIYCDFSGYSDIAIGTARLFGISLMRNFNMPYLSVSIPDFWRRWHISLTSWFRDYVYIPLGGNRCNIGRHLFNIAVVFTLSGLWHGANWTYVTWGMYHAVLMILFVLTGRKIGKTVENVRILPNITMIFRMFFTFALVTLGWIIFRAESIEQAYEYCTQMFSASLLSAPSAEVGYVKSFVCITLLMICEYIQRNHSHILDIEKQIPNRMVRWGIYYALVVAILLFAGAQTKFIYFQF